MAPPPSPNVEEAGRQRTRMRYTQAGRSEARSKPVGILNPSQKLTRVRPEELIVAKSQDLSTRRKLVFLSHLSYPSVFGQV